MADEKVAHENESEDGIRDPQSGSQINDETPYKSDSQINDETAYKSELQKNDETPYKSDSQKNDETAYKSELQKNDETPYKSPGAWVRSTAIYDGGTTNRRIEPSFTMQTCRTKLKHPFI